MEPTMRVLKVHFLILLLAAFSAKVAARAPQVIDSSRARADSLVRAGSTLHSNGFYVEAIHSFLSAGADTGTARERFSLGLSYAALNDFAQANRLLREAIALDSGNVNYRYQLARFLAQAGALDEGREQYECIVRSNSTYIPALFALGLLYNDLRSHDESAEMFRKILVENPEDFLSYYYLGTVLVALAKQDSAQICLRACLTLNPNFVPAMNLLASIYYAKKNYASALTLYREASALRPANADLVNRVGLCYRALDDYRRATDAFRRATELDSLSDDYLGNLGHAYYRVQKYDSSVFAYRRAIAIDPDNPLLHVNLALVLQRVDSLQSAVAAFHGAIRAHHPGEIADVYIQLGNLYFASRKYREAIQSFDAALRIDSTNAKALWSLASSLDDVGDTRAALWNYQKYLKLAENDSTEAKRVEWTRIRMRSLKAKE
jgi:tetratricopeptide (TPR) repeat protein